MMKMKNVLVAISLAGGLALSTSASSAFKSVGCTDLDQATQKACELPKNKNKSVCQNLASKAKKCNSNADNIKNMETTQSK